MIKALDIKNFTLFSEANLDFGRNLNIFVGENGAGKSHLLKLAYALVAVLAQGERESMEPAPSDTYLKGAIARKLLGVFRPDELGRLTRRGVGGRRCEVRLELEEPSLALAISRCHFKEVFVGVLVTECSLWLRYGRLWQATIADAQRCS
jgi:energy-coupling factor transporter ATP-binding protein EcfA2